MAAACMRRTSETDADDGDGDGEDSEELCDP